MTYVIRNSENLYWPADGRVLRKTLSKTKRLTSREEAQALVDKIHAMSPQDKWQVVEI